MCTITATELKENLGKYIKLAQHEEIEITHRGKVILYLTPKNMRLAVKWESAFGSLPEEALKDDEIDRE